MADKLGVINAALREVGEAAISALTGAPALQPRAVTALAQWPFAVDELLREHPWSWAKVEASLTAASPAPAFDWAYRYALPANYVRMIEYNGVVVRGQESDLYEIISGYLHADDSVAQVKFVARPNDGSAYSTPSFSTATMLTNIDPKACKALITLLASKLATPQTQDGRALALSLLAQYSLDLSAAITKAANDEKRPWRDPAAESRFVASRRRGPMG